MTVNELKQKLTEAEDKLPDFEVVHGRQDDLLLEFVGDEEVTKIFNRTTKWYA